MVFIFFSWISFFASGQAALQDLKLELPSQAQIIKFSYQELLHHSGNKIMSFHSNDFQANFKVRAIPLENLLKKYLKEQDWNNELNEMEFECADGYRALASLKKIREMNLHLAYEEMGSGIKNHWRYYDYHGKKFFPGPYYVVSTKDETQKIWSWPFQVVALHLIRFDEQFGKTIPVGASVDTSVYRGFLTFKTECLKCHSMNQQGGKIGPEFNVPKNILEYHDENQLRAFVRNAPSFRSSTNMPSFEKFTETQMDELFEYLKYMGSHKRDH